MKSVLGVALPILLGGSIFASCGKNPEVASTPEIIGGEVVAEDATDARRWSTVALTTDRAKEEGKPTLLSLGHSFCSGTIIGQRLIVTAAHCIQALDPATRKKLDRLNLPEERDFLVFFGTKVRADGKWIRAERAIAHPDWDVGSTLSPFPMAPGNDVGVIRLSEDIPEGYSPVEIAPEDANLGQVAMLAGFGVTRSRNRNDTGVLRQVNAKLNSVNTKAKRIGVGSFGKGACAGDSGGPLYVERGGHIELAGATSTGAEIFGNCLGLINNYTDVRAYREWLMAF